MSLDAFTWPVERLGEGLERVARAAGLDPLTAEPEPALPAWLALRRAGPDAWARVDRWLRAAAGSHGLELESVSAPHGDVGRLVAGAGPAILRVPAAEGELRFLLLVRGGGRSVQVLDPEGRLRRLATRVVQEWVLRDLERAVGAPLERLLDRAALGGRRRERVRATLARDEAGRRDVGGCWIVRLPPGRRFVAQARRRGLVRDVAFVIAAHVVGSSLWLASWYAIGRGALGGRIDPGWLAAWVLLLASAVPFRLVASWLEGRVGIEVGALLKRRLLAGGLHMDPDRIRHMGVGQLLGKVLESEAVEALALGAGYTGIGAAIELALAVFVLALGAGGAWTATLLVAWIGVAVVLAWRYLRASVEWTRARVALTQTLVERMGGHRTRLAQQAPERWHEGEDEALERYLERSRAFDRAGLWLTGLVPHGWPVVGVLGLAPVFFAASATPTALAVALGGILLARLALRELAGAATTLADCAVAWREVAPLFHAAARVPAEGRAIAQAPEGSTPGGAVLSGHGLVFRYGSGRRPVVDGADLRISRGERILLEGPSGGGKSTLATLLAGLRAPERGVLLLEGLDRGVRGTSQWRRRVPLVPQFHDNHLFAGTLAFNLLFGRGWPAAPEDLVEAETVCRELGLGPVIERMPSGLQQAVGETGWQLSHGERSRVFLARALLQGGDVTVFDESFAALDPASLRRALDCAFRRTPTLLVVAHP